MDISKVKTRQRHEEGLEVQIKCPTTGEPTDFYITVVGPDSKAWRRIQKEYIKRYLGDDKPTAEEEEQEALIRLADITIGWRGLTDNGDPVEFSRDACIELYNDAPYVMDQVDIAAGQFRNFIKG